MGKQIGQPANYATSPPAPAIRRARATCEAAARFRFTRFYVASPIPLPAQPAQSLLAAASGGRMRSEPAPMISTTLSLISCVTFSFPVSITASLCCQAVVCFSGRSAKY